MSGNPFQNMNKTFLSTLTLAASMLALTACSDSESYADLLNKENQSVNNFLADHRVELSIPADTVFETGENAPYYRLDEDGQLYMQVLDAGTKDNMVKNDEQIYFRYTRYGLESYVDGKLPQGGGNNLTLSPCWFRYGNFQIKGSYQWGQGIQVPLRYLPVDCHVNIIIKSQKGFVDEQTNVLPYLYDITYSRPAI